MTILRYPGSPITPAGAHRLLNSDKPHITYTAYDGSSCFDLMGPLAAPFADRANPTISLINIKGLIPPWKPISQKGATQDGETFVTALYDPVEADLTIEAAGQNPADAARVLRDWIAAWDAIKEGELAVFTPKLGRWWINVRWAKNPVDPITGGTFRRQKFIWPIKAYDAFWRSYDDVNTFRFGYTAAFDDFSTDHPTDLGTGWTINYTGPGTGLIHTANDAVTSTLANDRTAVARRVGYTSTGDNQVVEMQLGSFPNWFFSADAYDDVWARMANSGTPGQDGIRLRVGNHFVGVSAFVGGVQTVLRSRFLAIPPLPGETWTLICGTPDNPRRYVVLRDGFQVPLMNITETGTASHLGATYRSAGLGLNAGSTNPPADIRFWTAGDNLTSLITSSANVTSEGFVTRINAGDQPMYDRYTCYGPGTFNFADGPGSSDTVTFGPLLPNQIAQIRTDPRKRSVVDLTSTPATPQAKTLWEQAFDDFLSFAFGGNTPPLVTAIESIFGVVPPQGNLYSLLKGRFSDNAAIPAKAPGLPPQPYSVKVSITGGNAESKIVAAGTPLRRFPY